MAILKSDIKLMKSQRMEDTVDGGGRITGNEINDGEHNSMFPDISDLDRAYGAVNMAKTFLHVKSPDSDKYFGANVAILRPPKDPSVSTTIMTTRDHYDERADARDRVERYLARSVPWQGTLYGNQLEGQRTIRFYQRTTVRLPEIGEVFTLVYNEGEPDEIEQYVRVVDHSNEIGTFRVAGFNDEFKRRVVTCEISEPLRHTFEGGEISPYDTDNSPTKLRETIVANASKYYGIQPLAESASFADLTVRTEGVYSQLVPSSRTETPVIDLNAAGESTTLVESGDELSFTTSLLVRAGELMYAGIGITPGSLTVVSGGTTLTDDQGGQLMLGTTPVGTVDYARGLVTFGAGSPDLGTNSKTVTFKPAASPSLVISTEIIRVTEETRGYAYVINLEPIPGLGTLKVDFLVQGKWYSLKDQGNGVLKGADSSFGSGQIDFTTGSVALTLGALPDVDSAILFSWGAPVNAIDRKDDVDNYWFEYMLPEGKTIRADSVTVKYYRNSHGAEVTITETDTTHGVIERYSDRIFFRPVELPTNHTDSYTIDYDELDLEVEQIDSDGDFNPVEGGGSITYIIQGGNVEPNTVILSFSATVDGYDGDENEPEYPQSVGRVIINDDGNGNLHVMDGRNKRMACGTIDYASGQITVDRNAESRVRRYDWHSYKLDRRDGFRHKRKIFYAWSAATITLSAGLHTLWYGKNLAPEPTVTNAGFVPPHAFFSLQIRDGESLIGGSMRFSFAGNTYVERENKLYHSIDPGTGSGTLAGNLDLANNRILITNWGGNRAGSLNIQSLMTTVDHTHLTYHCAFRTPGAPLAPGSLSIRVSRGGTQYDVTADTDGSINSSYIKGHVDYETGIVELDFRYRPMDVTTLRYNCVVYNYLPLDASLIGLDPVRLPSDGRVPILTKGDVVVVHETKEITQAGVSPNDVISLPDVRIAELRLEDPDGNVIGDSAYTVDLDAGEITLGGSFSSTTIEIIYRIEDLVLLTDVEISGVLSLAKPLSHDYSTDAYVSSVCIAGNLWSRYSDMFDQQTWTGEWQDYVIGNETNAQFNDADFPMVLNNQGAITERWMIQFTGTTSFKLIGEHVGQIAVGTVNSDFSPLNPNTEQPYFTIPFQGWGSGWSSGNVLRFNTYGSIFPFWTIRTILQNDAVIEDDEFALQLRGNVNKD